MSILPRPTTKICPICGSPFKCRASRAARTKYCSWTCRRQQQHFPKQPAIGRFQSKVDKTPGQGPQGECWEWAAYRNKFGYGQFYDGQRLMQAHRFIWQHTHGPIPDGMLVCHKCDNPPCCNPDHLFLGTDLDNMHDMSAKGRHWLQQHPEKASHFQLPSTQKGEQHWKAKLTDDAVQEMRRLYYEERQTFAELARQFKIHRSTARRIIVRKLWKHV